MRVSLEAAKGLAETALSSGSGTIKSPGNVSWTAHGRCRAPVWRYIEGRSFGPSKSSGVWHSDAFDALRISVDVSLPCRKCGPCLASRGREWRLRGEHEIRCAERTWMGTFTLSPQDHWTMRLRASQRLAAGGTDFFALTEAEQWAEHHSEISKEITKYFKRLRRNTGAPLRYMLVAESHKSGLPHYHALIHERDKGLPLLHSALEREWKFGYSKFKLVRDISSARYVAKYLSKSADARIRASIGYGKEVEGENHELLLRRELQKRGLSPLF